ncbi:DUF1788 domain-containing protein [soil metagenome]
MSYVDDLVASYRRFVALPWQRSVAPPQRVWMAVYPPKYERRIRLNLQEFENATVQAGHGWGCIDITVSFERWMAGHEYAESYFEEPELLETALPAFFESLVAEVRQQLEQHPDPNGVVGLTGAGSLFGLGDKVKVSALMNQVNASVAGRLLVFFPGHHDHNSYRLLDARDGWNYLATPITAGGATR